MPSTTLACGCTLDTDFSDTEHNPAGNPYHRPLRPIAQPPPLPPEPEDLEEPPEDAPTKKKR